jgi:chromosome segregation ATPase
MPSHNRKTEESLESNILSLRELHTRLSEVTRPRDLRGAKPPRLEPGQENDDIVAQLEALISLAGNGQNVIDDLVSTIKDHEETIYDLKNRLSEATAQRDAAYQNAARAEGAIRAAKDRAEVAEARAKSAEEQMKLLQNRDAAVRDRIDQLTARVSNLASTGQIKSPFPASGPSSPRGAADRAA